MTTEDGQGTEGTQEVAERLPVALAGHGGQEERDPDLLQYLLNDARREIQRLRYLDPVLMMDLQVAGDGALPTQTYPGDAGLDLYTQARDGELWVGPGEFKDLPCGINIEFPPGVWGMILGRSSTLRRKGLLVAQAVIDSGYTGPIFAGVQNLGRNPVKVNDGERIAQLVLFPNVTDRVTVKKVRELSNTPRGERGFGSSG